MRGVKKVLILFVLLTHIIIPLQGCSDESVTAHMDKAAEEIKKREAGEMTIEDELGPLNLELSEDRYKARELVVRNINRIKKQHEQKLEDESGETAEKERIKKSIKTWMERVE
jgi:hypothetical protein